jgi:Fatty acid desaturase
MISGRLLRQAKWANWDLLLVALGLAHGGLLLAWPSIPLIALGLWWNANSISHNFIHRPFFRARALNAMFSGYLSLLLGFPHSLWRARHLSHHFARERPGDRLESRLLPLDIGLVIALWSALLAFAPAFSLTVYLPGVLMGLALCYLQGYYEHARGTVSHYGKLYNFLFFNDGYHVEHHARPGIHWRELPRGRALKGSVSRWPAVLRWLECVNLCALERMVLRSPALQRFVLKRHERALRRLLTQLPTPRRVGIVGGGLFPRTAIILSRLLPEAKLVLIDLSADNLDIARTFVEGAAEYVNKRFEP